MGKQKGKPASRTLARVDRLAFERLLGELVSRFADVPAERVATEVQSALKRLVEFFGYDRCTYAELDADGGLHVLAAAAHGDVKPHPLGSFREKLPWYLGELRAGRMVVLPALPKGLPAQARAEAEHVVASGLRSHLAIPVRMRGRTTGVLAFAGFHTARDWPADLIVRLTTIAEVIASAVARARTEEEAQHLRTRLWHADRVARVSALSAAIAHEINQPLAAILSNAQAGLANLGRGEAPTEEIRAILEAVVRDDKRAADTIRTMRAFMRREESGRARIDVAAALNEVLRLLGTEFGRKGIRVTAHLEPGCWVNADRIQIEQVALNLLLNAAQAVEACPVDERVIELRAIRPDEATVVLEVRDSGKGIAARDIESVFQPFWTTRKDGLGLGLAICRSIVEAHDGAISVAPNEGRGTTFRAVLPAAAPARLEEIPLDERASGEDVSARTATRAPGPVVCIVDDDRAVRDGLRRLLAAQGWAVAAFASAEEFLQRQPLATVGCILLDHQMPGMSGLELQQKLADYGATAPIVFLTGHGELATGVRAMKLGALDFLSKPADAGVLVAVVRKALERNAAERVRAQQREGFTTRLSRLSAREREVMVHVLRGRLNKQIAADLDIALQTVKQHRGRVMEKMEVASVAELVQMCSTLETAAERQM